MPGVISGDSMGRLIFTLPDDSLQAFKEKSADTGVPMAHYLRQAVRSFIESQPIGVQVSGTMMSGYLIPMGGR